MNKCFFTAARFTKDPDISYSQSANPIAIAKFGLAINRDYAVQEGQPTADFINCVAFGKTAQFIEKYMKKGTKVNVESHVQTGTYTNKEGNKVYTTDFIVDRVEFCNDKNADNSQPAAQSNAAASKNTGDFMNIPEGITEELPFN